MKPCLLFVFWFAFIGNSYGTGEASNLEAKAKEDALSIIRQIYPTAMSIFNSLRVSEQELEANEVDTAAMTAGNEILTTICTKARELTESMIALEDTAENMARKAAATEIMKSLYQAGGILSNSLISSGLESKNKGPKEAAEEIIKGLYSGAAKILAGIRAADEAGQVMIDSAI